jgi:hypothetical protein
LSQISIRQFYPIVSNLIFLGIMQKKRMDDAIDGALSILGRAIVVTISPPGLMRCMAAHGQ